VLLIFIWLGGDCYKLSYYLANLSPLALRVCASFQIFTDLCILSQFVIYRRRPLEKPIAFKTEDEVDSKRATSVSSNGGGGYSEEVEVIDEKYMYSYGSRASSAAGSSQTSPVAKKTSPLSHEDIV